MTDPLTRRERKLAETRLGLLDALLERMSERPVEEIGVRELCEAVDISEAGFFNHFPAKSDLLVYFVQLWGLEAAWHARQAAGQGVRAAVEAVFRLTARQVAPHPRVMAEVIAFQARRTTAPALRVITRAERRLRFPTLDGIEELEAQGFDQLLLPYLERAISSGELPATLDPRSVLLTLASIFFGVPLLLGPTAPELIEGAYLQQLDIAWRGLSSWASTTRSSP